MQSSTFFALLLIILASACKSSKQPHQSITLEDTYWKLAEVNGVPVITPEDQKEVHFILTSEQGQKRIKGFAGCNGLGGDYTSDGNKITFQVITTKMYCEKTMDIENFFTQALSEATHYKIKGDVLELYENEETFLAKFRAVARQ